MTVNLPPWLLGYTLAFWGWYTGLWWLGLILGLLAELPRYLDGHWEFGLQERKRVADLCMVLALIAAGYFYLNRPPPYIHNQPGHIIILVMQWSPALFFPLLAMQLYGGRDGMELAVLFHSLRGNSHIGKEQVDLQPFYLLLCIVAAAMLPPPGTYYYPGLSLIAIWSLWHIRSRGSSLWRWGSVLLLAISTGYGVGLGLVNLQIVLEDAALTWLVGNFNSDINPYQNTTAIGKMGQLKLSELIVLRVWPDKPLLGPLLLRNGNFTKYNNGTWSVERSPFKPLPTNTNGWHLPGTGTPQRWVKVVMELDQGRGILPLPQGSRLLHGLTVAQLTSNANEIVRVDEGPNLATYKVDYIGQSSDNPPNTTDLRIPKAENAVLAQQVQQLQLSGLPAHKVIKKISDFFQDNFHYSLQLETIPIGQSAIADFLVHNRTGHCEYFASAAVLLLRQAGIPARYAIGWSVQEYSELEQAYIARSRDAHAWVLVWLDGAWHNFDPTPADWSFLEAQNRPWWGWLQDLWAWLNYGMATRDNEKQDSNQWLIAGLLILMAILAWRIARRGHRRAKTKLSALDKQKLVTVFTPVEQVLSQLHGMRQPGETLLTWLRRLQNQGEPTIQQLFPILELYYRQCFDPSGINTQDKLQIQTGVRDWLQRYGK